MNPRKWTLLVVALALMAGAVGLLTHLRARQSLGRPGVKTSSLPGSIRLQIDLPARVLDYESKPREVEKLVLDYLPLDTSFGTRNYRAPDGFELLLQGVLMGTDRTSLHKPEFCLGGQGWEIDYSSSLEEKVQIDRPVAYELPVMKLIANKEMVANGQKLKARGLYVYWFVADGKYTARHTQRMWWMIKDLVRHGVLQRWAYISCFCVCAPGQEDAAFARMKRFIAAAVPEFQLAPQSSGSIRTSR